MPAEIEVAVTADTGTWHGLEDILPSYPGQPVTIDRILEAQPIFAAYVEQTKVYGMADRRSQFPLMHADNYRANIRRARTVDHDPLPIDEKIVGIVKRGYRVFQPFEQAELLREIVDQGELIMETALSLYDGSVTVLLGRLPDNVTIAGDETARYIAIVNSYDGSRALTVVLTPIRIVCANTLNLALRQAKRTWSIRHTAGLEVGVQDVRNALGMSTKYTELLAQYAERWATTNISQRIAEAFVEKLVPVPEKVLRIRKDAHGEQLVDVANQRAIDNAVELREKIREIESTTDHLAEHRGTGWGWLQAVSTYMDHHQRVRSVESRFARTLGEQDNILTRAQRVLEEVAA